MLEKVKKRRGRKPGRITYRSGMHIVVTKELHKKLRLGAAMAQMSMTDFVDQLLRGPLEQAYAKLGMPE